MLEELGNLVGVRVGLALTTSELDPVVDLELPDLGMGRRMSSYEFAALSFRALRSFGCPWTDLGFKPVVTVYTNLRTAGYGHLVGPVLEQIHTQVHIDKVYSREHIGPCQVESAFPIWATEDTFVLEANLERLDEQALLTRVSSTLGQAGSLACGEMLGALKAQQRLDPWIRVIRSDGVSPVPLMNLFLGGESSSGTDRFFDQRFVNYLAANIDDLDKIHWRQFERLTAEYFDRAGYYVELGPGSNDDGVDVRAWPSEGNPSGPPLLIVQCKRQKAQVTKIVVKALWADVQEEKAQRGVLATTSFLAPGAKRTIATRGYNVDVADRYAIVKWLSALRRPGAGIIAID